MFRPKILKAPRITSGCPGRANAHKKPSGDSFVLLVREVHAHIRLVCAVVGCRHTPISEVCDTVCVFENAQLLRRHTLPKVCLIQAFLKARFCALFCNLLLILCTYHSFKELLHVVAYILTGYRYQLIPRNINAGAIYL